MTPEGTTIEALRKMSTRELIQLIRDMHESLATLALDPYLPSDTRELYQATLKAAVQVARGRKKASATIAAEV